MAIRWQQMPLGPRGARRLWAIFLLLQPFDLPDIGKEISPEISQSPSDAIFL